MGKQCSNQHAQCSGGQAPPRAAAQAAALRQLPAASCRLPTPSLSHQSVCQEPRGAAAAGHDHPGHKAHQAAGLQIHACGKQVRAAGSQAGKSGGVTGRGRTAVPAVEETVRLGEHCTRGARAHPALCRSRWASS